MSLTPGQEVWYILENKIHSAPVLSIMTVENEHEDWAHTKEQKELFTRFGPAGVFIATVHTTLSAEKVFTSKEDLVASLLE